MVARGPRPPSGSASAAPGRRAGDIEAIGATAGLRVVAVREHRTDTVRTIEGVSLVPSPKTCSAIPEHREAAANMLTPDQERWVAHLSDEDTITIIPFDPTAAGTFERVKRSIQEVLGSDVTVEHHGATSLGISGQDEIDIYIPVPPARFDSMIDRLRGLYGEPRSLYPLERARFVTYEGGKHVDVFVINDARESWTNMHKFESYLKTHPKALEAYRKLKEDGAGLSGREYYRRKLAFFNDIVSKR